MYTNILPNCTYVHRYFICLPKEARHKGRIKIKRNGNAKGEFFIYFFDGDGNSTKPNHPQSFKSVECEMWEIVFWTDRAAGMFSSLSSAYNSLKQWEKKSWYGHWSKCKGLGIKM